MTDHSRVAFEDKSVSWEIKVLLESLRTAKPPVAHIRLVQQATSC